MLSVIDVVYVLGKGSLWDNNELKYSLRGVEKHISGGNIFIVGDKPGWITNVIHIPFPDNHRLNKERNIFDKICAACTDDRASDDFLFMNDDHFALADFNALDLPYYHREPLDQFVKGKTTTYKVSAYNTMMALKRKGHSSLNYDVHTPIIYNKEKFLQLKQYDWNIRNGYIIKSLYCNTHSIPGQLINDCKIQEPLTIEGYRQRVEGRSFFSIGDPAITPTFKRFMDELYPDKSKFEL